MNRPPTTTRCPSAVAANDITAALASATNGVSAPVFASNAARYLRGTKVPPVVLAAVWKLPPA